MSKAFKTPSSYRTPRSHHNYHARTASEKSDSEESTASTQSEGSAVSTSDLSILALFDDLMGMMKQQRCDEVEDAFITFAEQAKMVWDKLMEVMAENNRLQSVLDLKIHESSETESRLNRARQLLDEERKKCHLKQREIDEMEAQLDQVRELLCKDQHLMDAREKLSFLNQSRKSGDHRAFGMGNNLSAIQEVNSTGSMLSDYSVSRSEDDLDVSRHMIKPTREWNKQKRSIGNEMPVPAQKKRRSSNRIVEINSADTVRATTTVLVSKDGPITATSVIESVPNVPMEEAPASCDGRNSYEPSAPPSNLVFESWARQTPQKAPQTPNRVLQGMQSPYRPRRSVLDGVNNNLRQHSLIMKIIVMPESCICCQKRIRFGKNAMKCKECKSVCHPECKDGLVLPCVPVPNTPDHRNMLGVISDYTPSTSPMVPGLIVHCVNEIEQRGLNELGLFRIPGSEKEVKTLKEKFLKCRGTPSLKDVDIHVICGCIKDFLRSLTEPLTTKALWKSFMQAVEANDPQDIAPALYECISELPQPNRETLAYLMVLFQKIAASKECKMPAENLSKVFGPTLVGFSRENPDFHELLAETKKQIAIVQGLLSLPEEYWSSFVNVSQPTGRLQQTPSTDSLLRPRFLTGSASRSAKKQKMFATPPAYK